MDEAPLFETILGLVRSNQLPQRTKETKALNLPMFQVDAFASEVFRGNPAAVCPLETWLPDEKMQAIAAENNLAETAFFVQQNGAYSLRWFTPRCEVKLCGHATLASGFVVLNILSPDKDTVSFETCSGTLTVGRDGELLSMDFPSAPPWNTEELPPQLVEGLDPRPSRAVQVKENYFVVYEKEEDVQNARPNFALLEQLHPSGVGVTAMGKQSDFVSRYFAPSYGVPEDPVTGSIHCSLVPYWAERLGKTSLHARQISARGGGLWCELAGDRVLIKGKAVLYLRGTISV